MSSQLQFDIAGIHLEVRLDDSGITVQRGAFHQNIPWQKVTGAMAIRDQPTDREIPEQVLKRFGGSEMVAKMKEAAGRFGRITVAYVDPDGRKQHTDIAYDKADPAILNECRARLGSRWLGEAADTQTAQKKLKLTPGIFKSVLIFLFLLLVIALIGGVVLAGLLGPVFNLMSIQRMLLNLQDGDYAAFGTSLLIYFCLFAMTYVGHRVWRARVAMRRKSFAAPFPHLPNGPIS